MRIKIDTSKVTGVVEGGAFLDKDFYDIIDGNCVTETDLMALSWNLEPAKEKYKNKTVKKSIEQAIKKKWM